MPVQPTYPGVYIEEIPSGVRTITGVATSVTAFIGAAASGPADKATVINSFADYERIFGGLWVGSTMSYAVKDFYMNGGSRAVIVRVANAATAATITLPDGDEGLVLEAVNGGSWGNEIKASVNHATKDAASTTQFNLTLTRGSLIEQHFNVSGIATDPRFLPRILLQNSQIAKVQNNPTTDFARPEVTASPIAATGGLDGSPVGSGQFSGSQNNNTGLWALQKAEFNILCIPPPTRAGDTEASVYQQALTLCVNKRAMLLVDAPVAWGASPTPANAATTGLSSLGINGDAARNAALFFPRVLQSDPQMEGQVEAMVPCGMVAGIMARTDTSRGVWKSPAGLDAGLNGSQGLQAILSDAENGQLNPLGINCLRSFPLAGRVVWGARTLRGADVMADEYKYIAVRRTALFIEESLYRGTQWVVFEPNDEPLWAQIRLNVGAFMHNLFRQGAFQGKTPREAYLVKCDKETTTQNDINLGIVNILVGFAPLKPAEFVIIKIQQLAGQIES